MNPPNEQRLGWRAEASSKTAALWEGDKGSLPRPITLRNQYRHCGQPARRRTCRTRCVWMSVYDAHTTMPEALREALHG